MQPTTIITTYHFNASEPEKYCRLLKSLRASLINLDGTGCIVIVANGWDAEDPERVARELGRTSTKIIPHWIPKNVDISGSMNKGVEIALGEPGEWIASVQTSVQLKSDWLNVLSTAMKDPRVGAVFGPLFLEGRQGTMWNCGHWLKEGKVRHNDAHRPRDAFPCFSACAIRRTLIEKIVATYGSLISDYAPHYGDCPDFAIRAKKISPEALFRIVPEAVGYKREPEINYSKIGSARLIAAHWYYQGCVAAARAQLKEKPQFTFSDLCDIQNNACRMLAKPYARKNEPPPKVPMCLDAVWSRVPCDNPDCKCKNAPTGP